MEQIPVMQVVYTFRDIQHTAEGQDIDRALLNVTELVDGTFEKIDFSSAKMQNNELVITFNTSKTIDRGDSSTVDREMSLHRNRILSRHHVRQQRLPMRNLIIVN